MYLLSRDIPGRWSTTATRDALSDREECCGRALAGGLVCYRRGFMRTRLDCSTADTVSLTRRCRWPLVCAALLIMLCGAAALFGVPGKLAPLMLETDALTYVNPGERVAQDTRRFEQSNGLDVSDLWLQTRPGRALDPDFLRAVELLTRRLEQHKGVDAVAGPTTVLRWSAMSRPVAISCRPRPADWPKLAADLDQIMLTEPARAATSTLRIFPASGSASADAPNCSALRAMRKFIEQTWKRGEGQ